MWSASSSTVISMSPKLQWPCLMRSSRRPGHARTMSTPALSALTCGFWLTPPNTVRVVKPAEAPFTGFAPPAHAAIILSLETVFAALGGWLLLNEILSGRGLIGCALMFAGMLLSQLGLGKSAPPPTEPAVVPDPALIEDERS